jgi:predicted dehydrogenase
VIRLGLIGCGAWGWRYIGAAGEAGNCRVTHVAGGDSRNYDPNLYRIPSSEWRSLLVASVDAFIVATPPDTHEEICTTLLKSGRPVMVEKPLALSYAEAVEIVGTAVHHNAPLLVNHQHLFAPAYEALRERAFFPRFIRSSAGNIGPFRSYSALWDYGPHDVAMALGLGDPRPEYAALTLCGARREGTDTVLDLVSTPAQSEIRIWNERLPKTRRFIVSSPGWLAEYDDLEPQGRRLRINGEPIAISNEKPLTRSVRAFADAVRTGKTDWRFGGFGAEVVRILEDAEKKIQEG